MRAGQCANPQGEPAALLDELSPAELRVIRYLPSNLKAPEIASELFVPTNTIRTHLRHIYAKLGAHGRAEAVLAPGSSGSSHHPVGARRASAVQTK